MRYYNKPAKCKGHGCKFTTWYWAVLQKHNGRCIKKMKWMYRQGFMNEKMLKVNIKHIKKMGYKQF